MTAGLPQSISQRHGFRATGLLEQKVHRLGPGSHLILIVTKMDCHMEWQLG